MSSDEIIYRKQRKFCGKSRCRKCRDGIGHGPYWFATQIVNGKKIQVYLGKHLPPGVQAAQPHSIQTADNIPSTSFSPPSAQSDEGSSQFGRSHQGPLIGRDTEQNIMHSLLLHVEQYTQQPPLKQKKEADESLAPQRNSQCVLLLGEAGIGKTRLAEEVGRFAQQRGWTVLLGRTYVQESTIPYHLWSEVLRKAMAFNMTATRRTLTSSAHSFEPLLALLPELTDVLSHTTSPPLPLGQEQHHLWEAVHRLLTVLSAHVPLLVVLDDLQWADESSCYLLAYLARRMLGHAIILIGTSRDNELPPSNPLRPLLTDLHREQAIVNLSLQPLTNEQIASLVAPLPGTVVQYIQSKAAGNPFFAEEIARSVGSQFIASDTPSALEHLNTANPVEHPHITTSLPDTIAAVLELRMSLLSNACQRLLNNASVLGGSFTFPIICRMEGSGAASADEDIILDLVEEALQTGVLTEEGKGTRISYHFWHPLLVSHLYDQLSAARRARLHRRAAEVLQRTYQRHEEEGAATITNHLVEGGSEPSEIVHYAELAADRAYSLSAYPEAERYYRIAATQLEEVLRQQPSGISKDEQARIAYLLERLGECTRNLGRYEEARRLYEHVLDVRAKQRKLDSSADDQREAQIDALLWREIALTWYDMGDNARAQQYCEGGEQVLREAGAVGGPAWASIRFLQGFIGWRNGNYNEASSMANDALHLFEEALEQQDHPEKIISPFTATRRTLVGDPVDLGRTHMLLATIANSVGEESEALDHLNTALALFEQHSRQRETAGVCCNIGYAHLKNARHKQAQTFLRRSLHLAERVGDIPLMSVIFSNMGVLAERSGDLEEAEALFKQSLALAERINDQIYVSLWYVGLTIAFQDQGKLLDAKACIRRALSIGRAMNNALCMSSALVALGKIHIVHATTIHIMGNGASQKNNTSSFGKKKQHHVNTHVRFLRRAQRALGRALTLEGLEAETKIDGQLALTQVFLLQNDLDTAWKQAIATLEEARKYELTWEPARAQSLMGSILAAQGQQEQAEQYFEQAIRVFLQCGMRLEYAHTLRSYGDTLLQHQYREKNKYKQGLNYLREAHGIFKECHAALDQQVVERVLSRYEREDAKGQKS